MSTSSAADDGSGGVEDRLQLRTTEPWALADQIAAYGELGGTPHLDMQYTVFGQVVEGLDVLDALCAVQTDRSNRPNEDVKMTMTLLD